MNHGPVAHGYITIACLIGLFAQYVRGQNICISLGGIVALAVGAGARLRVRLWLQSGLYVVLVIILGYNVLLLRRRRRQLPPGLRGAKWIRLKYLAAMMKKGQRIVRCQLLKPEAFGDPATAAHLIVLSHRWMDGSACDMATHEYPQGLQTVT